MFSFFPVLLLPRVVGVVSSQIYRGNTTLQLDYTNLGRGK